MMEFESVYLYLVFFMLLFFNMTDFFIMKVCSTIKRYNHNLSHFISEENNQFEK